VAIGLDILMELTSLLLVYHLIGTCKKHKQGFNWITIKKIGGVSTQKGLMSYTQQSVNIDTETLR